MSGINSSKIWEILDGSKNHFEWGGGWPPYTRLYSTPMGNNSFADNGTGTVAIQSDAFTAINKVAEIRWGGEPGAKRKSPKLS